MNLNLDAGEVIIMEVRRHWFVFLVKVSALVIAALLPLALFGAFEAEAAAFIESLVNVEGSFMAFMIFIYVAWLISLWIFFFLIWTDYYLDIWIITNKRIIDIEQKGLFHREISSFRLDNIQDVTINIAGIFATLIGFGDIHVQTAGEHEQFIIRSANEPEDIKRLIVGLHDKVLEGGHKRAQGRL